MATAQVLLDTTQYVRVNVGVNRIMLQAMRDAVRIVVNEAKPSKSNTSFHLLAGDDSPLILDATDTNVWALATSVNASLVVTETRNPLPVATETAFSAGGETGSSFARVLHLTLEPNAFYSVRLEKNADIAIRYVEAKGANLHIVKGAESGSIVALSELISTNAILTTGFYGSITVYDGPATGHAVLWGADKITESVYPNESFVIELNNITSTTVDTYLSIGVQQISDAGTYVILQPDTLLEPTTEMSTYNGAN